MTTSGAAALWLLNLVLDTFGQVAFKSAARTPAFAQELGWLSLARQPLVWLGLACYCVEFFSWLAFLSLVPLSIAVLLASINIVSVMLAARWLFGEHGGPLRTAGILLIAAGVAIVGLGAP